MPYANSGGIRIYYQVEGDGPALVLQHPFTDSLETWYECGYVNALKAQYRLLLLDARGHGRSDKPHEPAAYAPRLSVADVTAVLDDVGVQRAHFWGYSMGGAIGFEDAEFAPQRFASLIIGGSQPQPERRDDLAAFLPELRKGPDAIAGWWDAPLSPAMRARLATNDMEALTAFWKQRMENPSLEPVLPTMTMPCLLYVGEADHRYPGIKASVVRMPHATFFSLPGLNHVECFLRSDLVLPHVLAFLFTVQKGDSL